jgi:hypothetical protein
METSYKTFDKLVEGDIIYVNDSNLKTHAVTIDAILAGSQGVTCFTKHPLLKVAHLRNGFQSEYLIKRGNLILPEEEHISVHVTEYVATTFMMDIHRHRIQVLSEKLKGLQDE